MGRAAQDTATRPFLVVALVLATALSTGCAADREPEPASRAASPLSVSTLSVAPVPSPLEAERFRAAPCDLIPDRQAGELGLPMTAQERTAGRPTCVLRPAHQNPLDTVTIRFQSAGLTTIARQCETSTECESWTADTIEDYPVIRANGALEARYGLCRLFVGVAEDTAFLVADGGAERTAADGPRCDRADRTAAVALRTLRGR